MAYTFKTLEESLALVLEKSKKRALSLNEILEILSGKGRFLFILLLALPFCQPIQIPGLSTPFGLLIAFFGLRTAFGHRIWLPQSLMKKTIPSPTLKTIIEKCLWLIKKIRPLIHPRFTFICHHYVMQIVNGVVIFFLGIFLALPLPIPLSNLVAAWALFFVSLGLLEDDGLFVAIGYAIAIVCLIFFFFLIFSFKKITGIFRSNPK